MDNKPKIQAVEIYLLLVFAILLDAINAIRGLNIPIAALSLPCFYFYFKSKKVPAYPEVIAQIIEFIPGLSAIPATTAGVIVCIILDRMIASKMGRVALKEGFRAAKVALPEFRPVIAMEEKMTFNARPAPNTKTLPNIDTIRKAA